MEIRQALHHLKESLPEQTLFCHSGYAKALQAPEVGPAGEIITDDLLETIFSKF